MNMKLLYLLSGDSGSLSEVKRGNFVCAMTTTSATGIVCLASTIATRGTQQQPTTHMLIRGGSLADERRNTRREGCKSRHPIAGFGRCWALLI
jgi:hypothetical protein